MLNVWCVWWGDKYSEGYVYHLRDMVKANLTIPHRFTCITDQPLLGVDTVPPLVDYPGWWQKVGLWGIEGGGLYFDLDVLIVGNIDYLAQYTEYPIAAPMNWAQSGYGGVQSSVLAWSGLWREPFERFDWSMAGGDGIGAWRHPGKLWGDQEWLTELAGDSFMPIPHVYSYKYHCRTELPHKARVVVFHGKPDPHEVEGWTLPYTQTLRTRIRWHGRMRSAAASRATG